MQQIPHNPADGIYSTGGDWVHALEVRGAQRMLFVSGTMGLRPDFTAPPSLEEQLECVWNNLRTILASAGMTVDNIVRLTSYLRDSHRRGLTRGCILIQIKALVGDETNDCSRHAGPGACRLPAE